MLDSVVWVTCCIGGQSLLQIRQRVSFITLVGCEAVQIPV